MKMRMKMNKNHFLIFSLKNIKNKNMFRFVDNFYENHNNHDEIRLNNINNNYNYIYYIICICLIICEIFNLFHLKILLIYIYTFYTTYDIIYTFAILSLILCFCYRL